MTESREQLAFARQLRREQTDAEALLWRGLRAKQLKGVKFRRQQPLGAYVVDFVALEQKLVVEIDGGHHSQDEVGVKDVARSRWLTQDGYRVLRFWNSEILANMDGVLETIREALVSPPPSPSPVEGEGK